MKLFKVLPNDPLLKSLTFSQREFIIASMNQDTKEAQLAAKGQKQVASFTDKSFEKLFYSNKNVDLVAPGDDPNEIYGQVLKLIARDDAKQGISEDYDQVLKDKIQHAYNEKVMKEKRVDEHTSESWKKYLKKAHKFYRDED